MQYEVIPIPPLYHEGQPGVLPSRPAHIVAEEIGRRYRETAERGGRIIAGHVVGSESRPEHRPLGSWLFLIVELPDVAPDYFEWRDQGVDNPEG
jgi:hypothetical protein